MKNISTFSFVLCSCLSNYRKIRWSCAKLSAALAGYYPPANDLLKGVTRKLKNSFTDGTQPEAPEPDIS